MIRVHGELDMATGDAFRRLVSSTIAGGHSKVVVEMSGVTFCDSEGLSALLDATRHAEAAGGLLTLVDLHPRVAKVIRITCLDRCLHIAAPDAS
ncbi:STAS domain-containing protein [Actinomadura rudentiformis]|nr:STAS domain-containing protein [Actinomadura rudentiformis]